MLTLDYSNIVEATKLNIILMSVASPIDLSSLSKLNLVPATLTSLLVLNRNMVSHRGKSMVVTTLQTKNSRTHLQ